MEENLNINELVKITQMPEIYSQLDKIGELVEEKTKGLNEVECTEENKQEAKKYRTYLNSIKTQLENKRKEIKKQIMTPYDDFNTYYEEKVKTKLDEGIGVLDGKISEIEINQIEEKKNELIEFYNNYQEEYHLENIFDFTDIPLKINLSNSVKSLKEEIVAFFEKISNDFQCISSEEFREEILIKYKNNGFDYANAKIKVIEKHKQIEELKKKNEEIDKQFKEEELVIQNVNSLVSAPIEVIEDEEILEVTFTCKATKDKLLKLKEWLKENEIEYE